MKQLQHQHTILLHQKELFLLNNCLIWKGKTDCVVLNERLLEKRLVFRKEKVFLSGFLAITIIIYYLYCFSWATLQSKIITGLPLVFSKFFQVFQISSRFLKVNIFGSIFSSDVPDSLSGSGSGRILPFCLISGSGRWVWYITTKNRPKNVHF